MSTRSNRVLLPFLDWTISFTYWLNLEAGIESSFSNRMMIRQRNTITEVSLRTEYRLIPTSISITCPGFSFQSYQTLWSSGLIPWRCEPTKSKGYPLPTYRSGVYGTVPQIPSNDSCAGQKYLQIHLLHQKKWKWKSQESHIHCSTVIMILR